MRLKQILANLLRNALKFGKGKPISVLVSFCSSLKLLQVDVVDSGQGMELYKVRQLT